MAKSIKGPPRDGIRKLNLRYHVDDPRFVSIEALRDLLAHGRGTGVLLAALAVGARQMLEQVPGAPGRPVPRPELALSQKSHSAPITSGSGFSSVAARSEGNLKTGIASSKSTQSTDSGETSRAKPPSGAVHFSEGTARQFEAFAQDN
jgi:hypothetical protein